MLHEISANSTLIFKVAFKKILTLLSLIEFMRYLHILDKIKDFLKAAKMENISSRWSEASVTV